MCCMKREQDNKKMDWKRKEWSKDMGKMKDKKHKKQMHCQWQQDREWWRAKGTDGKEGIGTQNKRRGRGVCIKDEWGVVGTSVSTGCPHQQDQLFSTFQHLGALRDRQRGGVCVCAYPISCSTLEVVHWDRWLHRCDLPNCAVLLPWEHATL